MTARTLADMTPAERQEYIGMWCDNLASTAKTPSPVVLSGVQGERCWILHTTLHGNWSCFPLDAVAPRFDLPRAWTSYGRPVPGEWDDDNGNNAMRRFQSEWEWKHDTPGTLDNFDMARFRRRILRLAGKE